MNKKLLGVIPVILLLTAMLATPVMADAPGDHGADEAAGCDVVNSDTDSADEHTLVERLSDEPIAEVYPAGSEKSVIVNEPY